MSIATLGYGVHITFNKNNDSNPPWTSWDSFRYWLAELNGLSDPSAPHAHEFRSWSDIPENHVAWEKYMDEVVALENNCPIQVVEHGCSDGSIGLLVQKTVTTSINEDVVTPIMRVSPSDLRKAQAFCLQNNIPFADPHWMLIAEGDF